MVGAGTILNVVFRTDPAAVVGNVSPLNFDLGPPSSVRFFNATGEVPNNTTNGQITLVANLNTMGAAVCENFDTLAFSGTSSVPAPGWFLSESPSPSPSPLPVPAFLYTAGTGSSAIGDTYSFGLLNNPDRAFGGLQTATLIPTIGAAFTNNTGQPIGSLLIAYTGEQWRLGALGRTDRLDFQFSTNATSLTTGTWTDVDALDFTAPVTAGTVGALNGNIAPNRTAISSTISGLTIANGSTVWIR